MDLQDRYLNVFKQNEIQPALDSSDSALIERYLEERARSSPGSAKAIRLILAHFLEHSSKCALVNITMEDAEDYLAMIDKKPVKLSSKKRELYLLYSFFQHFARKARREHPAYMNPIPGGRDYQFSPDIALSHIERERRIEEQCLSAGQILQVLQQLYYSARIVDVEMGNATFLIAVLQATCGMRISEAISIRIENVNVGERFLLTGIEDNARKSNRAGDKPLYFCFPVEVAALLAIYMRSLARACPDNHWLFPGKRGFACVKQRVLAFIAEQPHASFEATCQRFPKVNARTIQRRWSEARQTLIKGELPSVSYQPLNVRTIQNQLEYLGLPFPVRTHTFRKALETHQLNQTNNAPLHIVEVLSNHKISSVVMRHYNLLPLAERRSLYDKYFPREYAPILGWLRSLIRRGYKGGDPKEATQ